MRISDPAGDVLTMSSTTDTPEEIAAGLGIESPGAGAEPAKPAEAAQPAATATVPAEPATATPAPKAKKPTREQLAAQITDAQNRAADLERQLNELRARPAAAATEPRREEPPAPKPVTSPALDAIATERAALVKPKQADYADKDYDDYLDARDAYTRAVAKLDLREETERERLAQVDRQRTAAQTDLQAQARQRLDEQNTRGRATYHDWDQRVTDQVRVTPTVAMVLLDPANDAAMEMRYELATNEAERQRICELDVKAQKEGRYPLEAILALGDLRARLLADKARAATAAAPAGATEVKPAATVPVSAAPEPQGTTLGGGSGAPRLDLESASSQAEYNRMRNAQIKAKGRRLH